VQGRSPSIACESVSVDPPRPDWLVQAAGLLAPVWLAKAKKRRWPAEQVAVERLLLEPVLPRARAPVLAPGSPAWPPSSH
jgi:hypothetical protein